MEATRAQNATFCSQKAFTVGFWKVVVLLLWLTVNIRVFRVFSDYIRCFQSLHIRCFCLLFLEVPVAIHLAIFQPFLHIHCIEFRNKVNRAVFGTQTWNVLRNLWLELQQELSFCISSAARWEPEKPFWNGWISIMDNPFNVNPFSIDGNPWESILNRFWKHL